MQKKKSIILVIILSLALIVTTVSFGIVLFESFVSARGNITGGKADRVINVDDASKTDVLISSESQNVTFNKAGDKYDLVVDVNNNTNTVINYTYEFSFDTIESNKVSFASAILVYYNGQFINTLSNICLNDELKVERATLPYQNFIAASTTTANKNRDTFTFELHSASDKSQYDNLNSLSFNLNVLAKSADFHNYIYINNEGDFSKAINDINSNYLDNTPTLVLFNDITLTKPYTLNNPLVIDLYGHELNVNNNLTLTKGENIIKSSKNINISSLNSSANIILDGEDAYLNITDFSNDDGVSVSSLYSNIVRINNFDIEKANELIVSQLEKTTVLGFKSGETLDLLKGLRFYKPVISCSNNLINNDYILSGTDTGITLSEYIKYDNVEYPIKLIGNKTDILYQEVLEGELAYLDILSRVDEGGNISNTTSTDLFLPISIKRKNCSIEWVSSDESKMTSAGIIGKDINANEIITLTAYITINGHTYIKNYNIKVMSVNHDTLFQYFVAQLSPITLEKVYSGNNQNEAYYFLPILDANYDVADIDNYSGYDYRNSYTTPEVIGGEDVGYTWEGFTNIAFSEIKYSLISTYNFISIDQNAVDSDNKHGVAVYLAEATFQTFAQISVSAKFIGDDTAYTGVVNLIINTGYNTELNELVFNKIDSDLDNINILQNILNTRKEAGMIGENGNFTMKSNYQSYFISYGIPLSSKDVISKIIGYQVDESDNKTLIKEITYGTDFTINDIKNINLYEVVINPEGFGTNPTDFGINTILVMPTGASINTVSRVQYFNCPGVIKPNSDGFSNLSVFNSTKYQVWYQLAHEISSEKGNDNVEDLDYTTTSDTASFTISNNILTNHTRAYILRHDAELCTKLAYNLSETITNTDNHIIYGLSKLIDWAVSDTRISLSERFSSDTTFNETNLKSFITANSNVVSNGKNYLTDDESAIIKSYYLTFINNDETHWQEIYNQVLYRHHDESGNYKYTLSESGTFMNLVQTYFTNTSTYGANKEGNQGYSKFTEVYQWAHNEKDFADDTIYSSYGPQPGSPPDYGVIGSRDWSTLVGTDVSTWTYETVSSWTNCKYVKAKIYVEDNTEYFSTEELEILLVMLLNSKSTINDTIKQYVYNLRSYFEIPSYWYSNGIELLIQKAYQDLNLSVSGNANSGFKSEIKSFTVMNESFLTPCVTLFDGSTLGFDYFINLQTLYIQGDYSHNLKSFHQIETLNNFFNRLTSNNNKIINLAIEYASDSVLDFDIRNISNLRLLEKISFYHNKGIDNVDSLLNTNLIELTYVDIADINVTEEFSSFVMQSINLKANSVSVYYTPDNSTTHTLYNIKLPNDAEGLIYLEEFSELLSESAGLAQKVYTDSDEIDVKWAIEEGNGITLVDSTKQGNVPTINNPYTDYYVVLQNFSYQGVNFVANHLYKIYKSGNKLGFYEVMESPNNPVIVHFAASPATLSDDEVAEELANTTITKTSPAETDASWTYSSIKTEVTASAYHNTTKRDSNSTSRYPSDGNGLTYNAIGTSSTTITIYLNDGTTKDISVYGYGTCNENKTRVYYAYYNTITKNNYYELNVNRYYATISNGIYTISSATYKISDADNVITQRQNGEITYTYPNYYYTTRSRSGFSYVNTFHDLLYENPTAYAFKVGSRTYDWSESEGSVVTTTTETTTSPYQKTQDRTSETTLISAMAINNTLYDEINDVVSNGYVKTSNSQTYYNNGNQRTIQAGTYSVSLSSNATDVYSFTYTSSDATTVGTAYYMKDILDEANRHLNDNKFGLYYHEYYAYGGNTLTLNGVTYTKQNVYRLEIGNDNKFYFSQSSESNRKTYEVISGNYLNVAALVQNINSTYLGKIYYYNGSSDEGNTQCTNLFYEVRYNDESKTYDLKKFGVLDHKFDICTNGNFNNTTTLNNYAIPSLNNQELGIITNLMKYMDSTLFTQGSITTKYTYGIGGSHNAVISARVTVNGVEYIRKYLITVVG